jgi:hypothetical protein
MPRAQEETFFMSSMLCDDQVHRLVKDVMEHPSHLVFDTIFLDVNGDSLIHACLRHCTSSVETPGGTMYAG